MIDEHEGNEKITDTTRMDYEMTYASVRVVSVSRIFWLRLTRFECDDDDDDGGEVCFNDTGRYVYRVDAVVMMMMRMFSFSLLML